MGSVIGDILPVALGVAISPVPIIAVILMLLSPHARTTSLGFLVGWVAGIAVLVTLVTVLVNPAASGDEQNPSTWVAWVEIVLGLAAALVGVRQWRGRPTGDEPAALPGWMASIDSMTAVRALGLAAVLAAVNPKNLTLCLAGGVSIGGGELSAGETTVAVVVFVVIASSTVVVPVLGYLSAQSRMAGPLDELKTWLTHNNAVVMSVLMLVLGVVILGKGVGGL